MDDIGVIYLVRTRLVFAQMCMLSIASLRRSGYRGPVAVFSDLPREQWEGMKGMLRGLGNLRFDVVPLETPQDLDEQERARWLKTCKTRLDRLTPFRRNLYLDCDTIVCRSLTPVWRFLSESGRPIAMALDRAPTVGIVRRVAPTWGDPADWAETLAVCGPDARHFNAGVIYWQEGEVAHRLFGLWEHEISKRCGVEQAPLMRAIHSSGVLPLVLLRLGNVQTFQRRMYDRAIIRHFSGLTPADAMEEMLLWYAQNTRLNVMRRNASLLFCNEPCSASDAAQGLASLLISSTNSAAATDS